MGEDENDGGIAFRRPPLPPGVLRLYSTGVAKISEDLVQHFASSRVRVVATDERIEFRRKLTGKGNSLTMWDCEGSTCKHVGLVATLKQKQIPLRDAIGTYAGHVTEAGFYIKLNERKKLPKKRLPNLERSAIRRVLRTARSGTGISVEQVKRIAREMGIRQPGRLVRGLRDSDSHGCKVIEENGRIKLRQRVKKGE